MILYRIIPLNQKIEAIEYNGEYSGMRDLIPYDCLDHARLNKANDQLFVNDTGLLDGTEAKDGAFWWTYASGEKYKFVGIALLWGTHGEDNADPSMTIPEVYANISWVKPEGAREPNLTPVITTFDSVDELFAHLDANKAPWQ